MRCLLAETSPTGISLAIPPSLETTGAAWTAAIPTPSRGSSSTETNAERGRQSCPGETVGEAAKTADETEWAARMGGGRFPIKLPFSLVFVSRLIGLPQLRPLLSPRTPLTGGRGKGDPCVRWAGGRAPSGLHDSGNADPGTMPQAGMTRAVGPDSPAVPKSFRPPSVRLAFLAGPPGRRQA